MRYLFLILILSSSFLLQGCSLSKQSQMPASCGHNIIGHSMSPTLKSGDKVCIAKGFYKELNLKKKDLVYYSFKTREEIFVKRIIALPNDEVVFGKDFYIYLNGNKLEESYVPYSGGNFLPKNIKLLITQLENYKNKIPDDMILVLGDNRVNSFDSGFFGLLPIEYIKGKVVSVDKK